MDRSEMTGSGEKWKEWWANEAEIYFLPGRHLWFCGGDEIHVSSIGGVRESLTETAAEGVQSMLDDAGLGFRAVNRGYDPEMDKFIRGCMVDRMMDNFLAHRINDHRQESGEMHADVVLMPFHLYQGDSCPTWAWGAGCQPQGCAFLYLPENRQEDRNRDFIRKVAKHETWHLLTGPEHAHRYKVEGYEDVPDCITLPGCTTMDICEKCTDVIGAYWKTFERTMNRKYFK